MPDEPAAELNESPATAPAENEPNVAPSPADTGAKRRAFKSRLISTIILITLLAVAFTFSQTWIYSFFFAILSIGALIEYFGLFPDSRLSSLPLANLRSQRCLHHLLIWTDLGIRSQLAE